MSPVNKVFNFSLAPMDYANMLFNRQESIKGRCFLLVQAATSLLAIPVILLAGLIEAAIKGSFRTNGKRILSNTAAGLGFSLINIPESIVGAIIGKII